jgi:hypothetical protein
VRAARLDPVEKLRLTALQPPTALGDESQNALQAPLTATKLG